MNRTLSSPLSAEDHTAGLDRAPLVLVMYGDFECPYCAASFPIVNRVRDQLGERLLFAYRHFPIRSSHPDAQKAAEASEAAAAQGAFWPMHDRMFVAAGRVSEREIRGYAAEIGLDEDRIAAELSDGRHANRVERDLQSGTASGVTSTPAFFCGGRLLEGAFDVSSLVAALEASAEPTRS